MNYSAFWEVNKENDNRIFLTFGPSDTESIKDCLPYQFTLPSFHNHAYPPNASALGV